MMNWKWLGIGFILFIILAFLQACKPIEMVGHTLMGFYTMTLLMGLCYRKDS